MLLRPPNSTPTSSLFPYTTLCRPATGADYFLGDVFRSFSVVLELQGVGCATLSLRTQAGRITKHFGQRHCGLDDLAATRNVVHALYHTATGGQIAHDRAGVVFRSLDFNSHHGLEQHRASLAHTVLEGHGSSHQERVFV